MLQVFFEVMANSRVVPGPNVQDAARDGKPGQRPPPDLRRRHASGGHRAFTPPRYLAWMLFR